MNWEPTEQEVEEKLIELAYTWGDIEEEIESRSIAGDNEATFLSAMIENAFRVEAVYGENDFNDACSFYHVLFDVADRDARESSRDLEQHGSGLWELVRERARPWHSRDFLVIRKVPRSTPVEGQICRRLGQKHPDRMAPDVNDVPTPKPVGSDVELVERDGYWLTPIEVPFYDALRETGLFFAVQPWIQGIDRKYRLDFLIFYDGGAVAVELDGHEWHRTKEQRGYDAARDRWFAARKIQTLRWTGSQVHADPQACVVELLNVLRTAPARA
jgi:very-short-patch-repair endonuclease